MAVQGVLWLAKRLSHNLSFFFRISLLLFSNSYPIFLMRLSELRSRSYTSVADFTDELFWMTYGQMITGNVFGPNFLTFSYSRGKTQEKPSIWKFTKPGIEPGPAAWEVIMLPLNLSDIRNSNHRALDAYRGATDYESEHLTNPHRRASLICGQRNVRVTTMDRTQTKVIHLVPE